MEIFYSKRCDYTILASNCNCEIYPLIRQSDGDVPIYSVSPLHGRSYMVGRTNDQRYIISKGNGLSYTQWAFLNSREYGNNTWGLLLEKDALRDFSIGKEIESLGIKTNHMQYVVETDYSITISESKNLLKPILLQYDVECPYRIEDAPFMSHEQIWTEVKKWDLRNARGYKQYHLIAADILVHNLNILHEHGILHNAITTHNYTWALELLDFEIAHSPNYPYPSEKERQLVSVLFNREITDIYKIIIYIAGVLQETVDYKVLDAIFEEYGFNLQNYQVSTPK